MQKIFLSFCVLPLISLPACSNPSVDPVTEIVDPIADVTDLIADVTDLIAEINNNSNFPFPLTLPEKDLQYGDEYVIMHGFGCYELEKEGLQITLSGWPDVVDEYHVTDYRFTAGDYHVFGISTDTTLEEALSILQKFGYTCVKSYMYDYIYQKTDKVEIRLWLNTDNMIYKIRVSAISTNVDNVLI